MLGQIRNILLSLPFALKKWNKNFSTSTRYIRLSVFSELFCWFQRQNFAPDWKTLPRHKKVGVKSTREERGEVCKYNVYYSRSSITMLTAPKNIKNNQNIVILQISGSSRGQLQRILRKNHGKQIFPQELVITVIEDNFYPKMTLKKIFWYCQDHKYQSCGNWGSIVLYSYT